MQIKNSVKFTKELTENISNLSKLSVSKKEENYLTRQFNETLKIMEQLKEVPTKGVKETSQVTGLKNVFREDKVDEKRGLSQIEALSNAKKIHKGFFVVKAIFNEK